MKWYSLLLIFLFALIIIRARIKKRGYLAKDKSGKPLKTKEFFQRWKEGIEGITPLQQARTNLMGNWITMTGILSGIIINALIRMSHQWWWIEIILMGSLILGTIQMINLFQKYWKLKKTDEIMKELNDRGKKNEKKM